jgi:8-oxo-dGTP diphosphatase
MGFILFLIASIIKWLFAPIAYLIGCIVSLFKREFNTYHTDLAIAKDQYGNAICKYMFNWLLIKKGGYSFGNIDETISSVIGKNKAKGTLTIMGKTLDFLLELCESDHSIKSIDKTEDNTLK